MKKKSKKLKLHEHKKSLKAIKRKTKKNQIEKELRELKKLNPGQYSSLMLEKESAKAMKLNQGYENIMNLVLPFTSKVKKDMKE